MTIIAATGHRPSKLPTGYNPKPLIKLAGQWLDVNAPDLIISGMALGWDQAVALAAIERSILVHAYVPFVGQADKWPAQSHATYQRILQACDEVKVICPGGYLPEKMQKRNEAMVDACDRLLALWDGTSGGTGNCITYAEIMGVPYENLWTPYLAENQEDDFEV
jgi:uncharacterized phage-like protein YoqJ